MKYQEIPRISPTEIELAISRNYPEELWIAVLSAAFYADNVEWSEAICARLAAHENETVRGNAILGLGHIARINGKLSESLQLLIENALHDDSEYVRGQAEAAANDVELFLQWRVNRQL